MTFITYNAIIFIDAITIEMGADTLRYHQQICPIYPQISANKQGNLAQIALFETRFTPNAWVSSGE
ncbi:MAG: hypothetical protein QME81_19075 [bacterium]|nr:hypothetical protein [bacterium]